MLSKAEYRSNTGISVFDRGGSGVLTEMVTVSSWAIVIATKGTKVTSFIFVVLNVFNYCLFRLMIDENSFFLL